MTDTSIITNFTYPRLDSARRQIRLLKLLPQAPASWRMTIECELLIADLDDALIYEALSYVWCSENKPCDIVLNGRAFTITTNLYSALMHLSQR
jgi:hypothetical protein